MLWRTAAIIRFYNGSPIANNDDRAPYIRGMSAKLSEGKGDSGIPMSSRRTYW